MIFFGYIQHNGLFESLNRFFKFIWVFCYHVCQNIKNLNILSIFISFDNTTSDNRLLLNSNIEQQIFLSLYFHIEKSIIRKTLCINWYNKPVLATFVYVTFNPPSAIKMTLSQKHNKPKHIFDLIIRISCSLGNKLTIEPNRKLATIENIVRFIYFLSITNCIEINIQTRQGFILSIKLIKLVILVIML